VSRPSNGTSSEFLELDGIFAVIELRSVPIGW
jgi:hypothetical protein